MQLSDFDFSLPEHLIAQHPAKKREHSRLLHIDRSTKSCHHGFFYQIEKTLKPYDLLIMNNSRTMNARLFAQKQSGGKVEILIEQILTEDSSLTQAKVMLKCNRKPHQGERLILSSGVFAEVLKRDEQWFYLRFNSTVFSVMEAHGQLPLPPYIKRPKGVSHEDQKRYQTIYADKLGSVATPTAGLHFSKVLLQRLAQKNILHGFLTLHVGSATFQPIRTTQVEDHTMHKELIEIDQTLCDKIHYCQKKGGRIIAVGTTSVRALESMMRQHQKVAPFHDYSDIFLYPGVKFELVQGMITNFHLPKSTLFILVCAFAGTDVMKRAYSDAIAQSYRFFSYGDAMLII